MRILHGDCREVMASLPAESVDSIVTDPPYGLSFMGKAWDYDVPAVDIWRECFRVLKPGGHLLSFAGTRTQHRMAVNIEDAGFEIRDMIAWVYGSGFPKSLDVSKAIDKAAGAERESTGPMQSVPDHNLPGTGARFRNVAELDGERRMVPTSTAPATESARQWQGWGTALKPALEPITVARKPLVGTVAANVLAHGTGALNIDGCRVKCDDVFVAPKSDPAKREGVVGIAMQATGDAARNNAAQAASIERTMTLGRWPANLIHDGSDEVVALFPQCKPATSRTDTVSTGMFAGGNAGTVYPDSGSAARFFYCAKASKRDRGEGNSHPTVKPTDLMRYLCRLVTPPGGTVLDPFMGSGSTGKAALLENFEFIGIEREAAYVAIAHERMAAARTLWAA